VALFGRWRLLVRALVIEMGVTPQAQAVLLLTAYLSKTGGGGQRPLSPGEWGRFALWLKERGVGPEALLSEDLGRVLAGWEDKSVTVDRIRYLVGRAAALGLALERWHRAGLWVMTRSDADYPSRLKQRLRTDSPPVLFGSGNRKLLGSQGIAVVGSRSASESDLSFATRLGGLAAAQGFSVVSGGARGIDEAAMLGALNCEGTAIGVLAEGLLRASLSTKYREGLMSKNLVLISPFNPEAGFDVGNAMARNKYVYCLSDAAIVVSADKEKGGTWNGALENINQHWVPLWVKTNGQRPGNMSLVGRGGRWLPEGNFELRLLLMSDNNQQSSQGTSGLFDRQQTSSELSSRPELTAAGASASEEITSSSPLGRTPETAAEERLDTSSVQAVETISFYSLFLRRLRVLTTRAPATVGDLLASMDIGKSQLQEWLKRAVSDGHIKRLQKPVKYEWRADEPRQGSMFQGN
jgi:predicted Rossmann fold nucleotide-binding protein DprA/Smf involved in DNA uptake